MAQQAAPYAHPLGLPMFDILIGWWHRSLRPPRFDGAGGAPPG